LNSVLVTVYGLSNLPMYFDPSNGYPDGCPASGSVGVVTPPGENPQNITTTKDTVGTGTTIVLEETVNTLQDGTQIRSAINSFYGDFYAALGNPSLGIPMPSDYFALQTWSTTTTAYRLIHINSGSGWAIATSSYTVPHPYYANHHIFLGDVFDGGVDYQLYGEGGNITEVRQKISGVWTDLSSGTFSGTFKPIDNSGENFHGTGSITRSNSTTFSFDELISSI
jgi:hypothetical protein